MQPIIKMCDIKKSYHSEDISQMVLRGIYLEILPNELVAIMGTSGSGKSTLMNIIGLLDRADSGEYFLNGKNVTTLSDDEAANARNQTIGFVFQSFFLLPRLTILENVALPLYYRGISDDIRFKRAKEILNKVELGALVDRKPGQLSGGQQQRAAIARALVGNPTFILADEPTGALDTKTGKIIMDMFIHLNKNEQVTIIVVTHDSNIAAQCQRTLHIHDGLIG